MLVVWVTMNMCQRFRRRLVHLPVPVTFYMSQLGLPTRDYDGGFSALCLRAFVVQ